MEPPLKISALDAVAAQFERAFVSIRSGLALVHPTQQVSAGCVVGIIAICLIFEMQ
jgi:hypothetical protein